MIITMTTDQITMVTHIQHQLLTEDMNNLATFFKLLFYIHFTGVGNGCSCTPNNLIRLIEFHLNGKV